MTESEYQADVTVEIAFNAGYATPSDERVWTDVSEFVELADRISISRGRQDEISTAGANRLTLTLDNSDGRFTPERAESPYYPNVKIGRPIRVTATPAGVPTITYEWAGPPGASASIKKVNGVEVARNLFIYPGSETTAAFVANGGSNTPVQDTAHVASGTYSTKINRGSGSSLVAARRRVDDTMLTGVTRAAGKKLKVSYLLFTPAAYNGSVGLRLSGAGISESSAATHVEVPGLGTFYLLQTSGTDAGSGAMNVDVTGGTGLVSGPGMPDIWTDEVMMTYGDADHVHGPYFSGDTPDQAGSVPQVRFVGYVDEWPVEWPGVDTHAMSRISATSRIARLGLGAEMDNLMLTRYLAAEPAQLFTLLGTRNGEIVHADTPSVLGFTGPGRPVVMAAGLSPQGESTCALFSRFSTDETPADSQYLEGPYGATMVGPIVVAEAWITTTVGGDNGECLNLRGLPTNIGFYPVAGGVHAFCVSLSGSMSIDGSIPVDDGELHHVAVVLDETADQLRLYVDGILDASAACSEDPIASTNCRIGAAFAGSISWVMISADEDGIAARAENPPVQASDLMELFAATQGIPATELDVAEATHDVVPFDADDKTAIDAMRVVEATEGGVLFDSRENLLTLHGRGHRYNTTPDVTLDLLDHEVEADLLPKLDRSGLLNDVSAKASDGTTARAVNQESIDDYGYARSSIEVAAPYSEALAAAQWRVNTHGSPRSRIPSLSVDVLPLEPSRQADVLALDVSSRITLDNLPSQAPGSTAEFFVEGYTEEIGIESYRITFNVSPTSGYDVFALDDPVRGVLDSDFPLAY